jgi:1-deoxy-D-xylulose-5-phosphate reductoisomerase
MRPEGIAVLGATGSIGASSLDVIARHPERFRVVALTAHGHAAALAQACERFRPELAVVADAAALPELESELRARGLPTLALGGAAALEQAACWPGADTVIAAIVGAAGLAATLAAARAGKRLLIANKEAIVCAGALLQQAVQAGGGCVLPVDSEHSAIHQCLTASGAKGGAVRLILTASGGPFRQRQGDFEGITPAQAVAHPNWVMGRKISVDSATLMNKGLEVIEANWLFGFTPAAIDVVVHPQSVIHSMVEFADGSVLAQLGAPDMRTPIAYALGFPERIDSGSPRLDLLQLPALTFEPPDTRRFPCLKLAYDALRAGGAASIVLNAANEIAVAAFLDGRLPFTRIAAVIEETLAAVSLPLPGSVQDVVAADATARVRAAQQIEHTPVRSAA